MHGLATCVKVELRFLQVLSLNACSRNIRSFIHYLHPWEQSTQGVWTLQLQLLTGTTLLPSHNAHPMTPTEGARWELCRRSSDFGRGWASFAKNRVSGMLSANRNSVISVCYWVRFPWTSYFPQESRKSDLVFSGLNNFYSRRDYFSLCSIIHRIEGDTKAWCRKLWFPLLGLHA